MARVSFLASGTLCDRYRGVTMRLSTRRDSRGWCQDGPRFLLFWDDGTALLFCAVFFVTCAQFRSSRRPRLSAS